MKLQRRIAAGMVAICAVGLVLVGVQMPAHATQPANWSTSVNPDYPQFFTAADGSVMEAACGPTSSSIGVTTYASDGGVQATIPTTSGVSNLSYCDNTAAVGADGTLYGNDETTLPTENVAAYSASGVKLWSQRLVTTDCTWGNGVIRPQWIRVGADGNVYVSGRSENDACGHPTYLVSLTTGGAQRWQTRVGSNPITMAVYGAGVVVFNADNRTLYFVGYDGVVAASQWVSERAVDSYGVISVDMSGTVFFGVYGYAQSSCGGGLASILVAYNSSGEVYNHAVDSCVTASQPVALGNGKVGYFETLYPSRDRTLVVLDASGATLSRRSLEVTDGVRQFSLYTSNVQDLVADTNGNLLLMRGYSYTYNGQTQYGLQFDLVNPSTGGFMAVFNSDSVDTSAKLSYRGVALASNKMYFLVVDCTTNNCSSVGATKLYSVSMGKLGMDYPRGAVLGVQPVTFDRMAVAGDSYSSGVGSLLSGQTYDLGTDTDGCDRSPNAYAYQLAQNPQVKLQLPSNGFVACAGATTDAITQPYNSETAQAPTISTDTKSIFITIGGNDVKFGRFGALCIFLDCSSYQDEFSGYLGALQPKLETAYKALLDRAPGATLYVIGYPHILPLQDCTDSGSGGWWFALGAERLANPSVYIAQAEAAGLTHDEAVAAQSSAPTISNVEATFANTFENNLNLTISDAVDTVAASYPGRIVYVSSTQPGGPMEGHQLCSTDPYFNGLDGAHSENTFHPNAEGQGGLSLVAGNALAANQPQYVMG